MSRMRVLTLTLALLLYGAFAAGTAEAQQKPDFAAARKHYVTAQAAEKAGDYDTAVAEYAAAYDITKDSKILYSIARSYEAGGNKDAAVVYYRRYVNEAKDAKDRDDVKKHIAAIEAKTPTTVPPPGGGETKPPGEGGDLIAPKPSGGDGDLIAPRPPGGGEDPPDGPGDDPGIGDAPSFEDGGTRWQRTAAWVSVGVAAVALTTGAVLGESALSRKEDIQRLQNFRDPDSGQPTRYTGNVAADYNDALDEGEAMESYAIVAFSIAGVAAIGAIVFFAIDPGPSEVPGTTGARARPVRYVMPMVTPDGVGVTAGWGF